MKKLLLIFAFVTSFVFANQIECFTATNDLAVNAQKIRLSSKLLGWKVGQIKSFAIATIIKAKQKMYPDGEIKVCIKELDGDLKYIMYSTSTEDKDPKWHFLTASKTGWF
jgi:hypothetical protein